ncbi:hypothetical protein B5E87_00305 [Massilimicrobiota sp. An142]|uniref:tyrosine-type recombinase/integrase n=1 Tax=Massilimicrobiota sp. An142 TaxID=1965564 RepID=UPI000B39EB13|nr:site-specific integrase [Massilimicrobiota sp. An142]OUQ15047.1 hypothetical protein B5E87_00305 [Massilimicrobiota sp. An142]
MEKLNKLNNHKITINDGLVKKDIKIEDSIANYLKQVDLGYIARGKKSSSSHISSNSKNRKNSDIKKFLKFLNNKFPKIKYTYQITPHIILEYYNYLQQYKTSKDRLLSNNSKRSYMSNVVVYLQYAYNQGEITNNTHNYILSKNYLSTNQEMRIESNNTGYLSNFNLCQIFKNLEKTNGKPLYLRNKLLLDMLCLGLRANEILEARWRNYDWNDHTLFVNHKKVGKKDTIYLPKMVRDDINTYYHSLSDYDRHPNSFIFKPDFFSVAGDNNKPMTLQSLNSLISSLTEGMVDNNGNKITSRTFRKTFTILNLKLGTPLPLIQNYTEHNINTLSQHYSEYINNMENEPAQKIEEYFNFIKSEKPLAEFRDSNIKHEITISDVLKNEKLMEELKNIFKYIN